MSFLSNLFGGGAASLLKGIEGVIDKVVTTDKERELLKNQMRQQLEQFALDHEAELTKRHQFDMNSDSWLSKNIRPMSLVFSTAIISLMTFTDGNIGSFEIQDAYINLFQNLMLVQYSFYFGSRAIEKYNVIKYSNKLAKDRTSQEQSDIARRKIAPVDL